LVGEAPALQDHVNEVLDAVADVLEHSARLAGRSHPDTSGSRSLATDLLMDWVQGRWLRFVQSGWQEKPTDKFSDRLRLLGL